MFKTNTFLCGIIAVFISNCAFSDTTLENKSGLDGRIRFDAVFTNGNQQITSQYEYPFSIGETIDLDAKSLSDIPSSFLDELVDGEFTISRFNVHHVEFAKDLTYTTSDNVIAYLRYVYNKEIIAPNPYSLEKPYMLFPTNGPSIISNYVGNMTVNTTRWTQVETLQPENNNLSSEGHDQPLHIDQGDELVFFYSPERYQSTGGLHIQHK